MEKKKKFADISRPKNIKKAEKIIPKKAVSKKVEREIEKKLEEIDRQVEKFEKDEKKRFEAEETKKVRRKDGRGKRILIWAGAAVTVALFCWLAASVLPKAEIIITTKKSEWKSVDSIIADKSISQISADSFKIPAEVFSLTKNFSFSFPATGDGSVQTKATGKITIYNNYSSGSQTLVATTRFEAPDGKIFRLNERTVVPGKTGSVPGEIEALVTADKAGEEYNIGPVGRFTIPGFKSTDKYQGFYAESFEPMKGGFVGVRPHPTENDISLAKTKSYADLKDYIDSLLISQMPEGFKIIEGSRQFSAVKEEASQEVDEKGNFSFFVEGKSSIIGFKEEDAISLMEELGKKELGSDFRIFSFEAEYGAGRSDFNAGTLSFALDFKGVFERPVNAEELKKKSLSMSENEIKSLISSFDNIEKAMVLLSPFWVRSVPKNPDKVSVVTQ
jgi:tetrahydromethanopterin S-methyltransferase subunit G